MADPTNSDPEYLTRPPRILLIDDNECIHIDYKKALGISSLVNHDLDEDESFLFGDTEEENKKTLPKYHVDSAFQGEEGFEMAIKAKNEGKPYSLAFVDIRMPPGIDGIETVSRIWKECPDLQIVICSAHSDYSWEEIFEILEPSDKLLILKKPFERVEVLQMAHAMTQKWELERQVSGRLDQLESKIEERTQRLKQTNKELEDEIQERIVAQQEKETMASQLLQAQKLEAIGQLSAGIAHEINTPTQYIGDNTRYLKDSFEKLIQFVTDFNRIIIANEDGAELCSMIGDASQRFSKNKLDRLLKNIPEAIDDTLEGVDRVVEILRAMKVFSSISPKDKSEANIHDSIKSTITVARSEWNHIAEIETDFDENMPLVSCYIGELNQAILNLIVNASHAIEDKQRKTDCRDKGEITIRTKYNGDSIQISVSDSGTGIPEEAQSKIFDPFFTTKEVGKGTGQGLAMTYNSIVKNHGGELSFETKSGKGTTFHLKIPFSNTVSNNIDFE